ncbi:MAG: 3-hydroxyacyl-CoA dehydrogenase NAD-binding domain-containing protein [Desertimonas sp.]
MTADGAAGPTGAPPKPGHVAIVGAGVIGAGWAARLRLKGIDVTVYDPSDMADQVLGDVFELATRAWHDLGAHGPVGTLARRESIAAACDGADVVIESVPERLALKIDTYAEIESSVRPTTVITSSTSGFRPSALAAAMTAPERFLVAHPFNPVYLVPLVELVGGPTTAASVIDTMSDWLRRIGMHPLLVRREIDAHIADRLLEAMWREALWLVNDGVATTAEIDDAIRYGFGLRMAQMGLFETYRIAGGEGGMRHFLGQFGDALTWPWTKLMDTPALTDELVATIADQSDRQSGGHTIRELERQRDRNLTQILLALEGNRWGAGLTLDDLRAPMAARTRT